MLKGLQDAVNSKSDKTKNWTIQQGLSPGVKYRGGTPPSPPLWNYGCEDLRAFQKWTRKIEVWIQVAAYLPPMLLYVSLQGEAEEELEWCDVSLINNEKGIDYIIETLKQRLMTKAIYLKRRYLHEYEYVQRQHRMRPSAPSAIATAELNAVCAQFRSMWMACMTLKAVVPDCWNA